MRYIYYSGICFVEENMRISTENFVGDSLSEVNDTTFKGHAIVTRSI
jgi:hypothetical protein